MNDKNHLILTNTVSVPVFLIFIACLFSHIAFAQDHDSYSYEYNEDEPIRYMLSLTIEGDYRLLNENTARRNNELEVYGEFGIDLFVNMFVYDVSSDDTGKDYVSVSINDLKSDISETRENSNYMSPIQTHYEIDYRTYEEEDNEEDLLDDCASVKGIFDTRVLQSIPYEYSMKNIFAPDDGTLMKLTDILKCTSDKNLLGAVSDGDFFIVDREREEYENLLYAVSPSQLLDISYFLSLIFPKLPSVENQIEFNWEAFWPILDIYTTVYAHNQFAISYSFDRYQEIDGIQCLMIHGETYDARPHIESKETTKEFPTTNSIEVDICYNIDDGVIEYAAFDITHSSGFFVDHRTPSSRRGYISVDLDANYDIHGNFTRQYD